MRRLPTKAEIIGRAAEREMERQMIAMGIEPITPTEAELKESGVFHEARNELMRGPDTAWLEEQRRYLEQMASEMGLKVISRKEYHRLSIQPTAKPKPRVKHGARIPRMPTFIIPRIFPRTKPLIEKPPFRLSLLPQPRARPKKRTKRHTQRNGKTMRKLRNVKGVKVFAFPDHIWKVRNR